MAELFVTPIVENVVNSLTNILKNEIVSIFNVKKELGGIESTMNEIMHIIKNADKKSFNDECNRSRMTTLKDIAYEIDDIIDDCKIKAQALAPSSSMGRTGHIHLKSFSRLRSPIFSHKIAKRLKKINVRLEDIRRQNELLHGIALLVEPQQQSDNATRVTRNSTPSPVDTVGCVEEDAKRLMKLMLDQNESNGRICVNLAILGMGGIGKTTLAQKIHNEVEKTKKFQQEMWICVSKDSKEKELLKEIIRCAGGKHGQGETVTELTVILQNVVRDKKFFLVLDDVWDADIWDDVLKGPLNSGANGSKIVVTTRDVNIARRMFATHKHEVEPLSIEKGWLLLRNSAFNTENERNNSEYLKNVGVKIVKKCGQLPLAIKAIAGILRGKERIDEWEQIIFNYVWTQNNMFQNDNVMKALYLSYEDLPYELKQCFVYCSLFPEDSTFDKRKLVELWIAEGFLGDKITIAQGEVYHKDLVNRNLLQPDHYTTRHRLHDLLRSLGQILGKGEYFYGNLNNLGDSFHRLSFRDENPLTHDHQQKFHKGLRTLMLFQTSGLKEIPLGVFQKLQYLRVLILFDSRIQAIPDSIKYLLHLRYLDISDSDVKIISESIGYLKNLQFIHLDRCRSLEKLPQSVINLQNLITLDYTLSTTIQLPKGIKQLEKLQSLVFRVAENENEAELGCPLHELQSLNLLKELSIYNLQKNLSSEEAKSVGLVKKNQLQHFDLHWKPAENVSDDVIRNVTEVIKELCPPSSLLYLFIHNFYGHSLPNWMSYSCDSSLDNLVQLEIQGCKHCQQLPGFGNLPQLQVLRIYEASSIQNIGPEFLGSGGKSTSTYFRPFAKLESMRLEDFSNLEQWHWDVPEDDQNARTTPFPCLQYLFIEKCPKLKSLPEGLQHATSLLQLCLDGNKDLERIPKLPTVKDLFITNCSSIQHVGNLNSLEYVWIVDVKLNAIPSWLSSLVTSRSKALSNTSSIQKLCIGTGELQLLRRLCPWDIGVDWPLIKDFPHVYVELVGQDCKAGSYSNCNAPNQTHSVGYIKSPFSIAAILPNTGFITINNPHLISKIYKTKFATTVQTEVLDITPATVNQLWKIRLAKQFVGKGQASYLKLPFDFHEHLKITSTNGRTRVTCIHQSYFDEPAVVPFPPFKHTHLPYTTNQGETGMACLHKKHMQPKGPRSQASSSTT